MEAACRSVFLVGLVFLLGRVSVLCHPQCLDFKPPFDASQQVNFCHQYRHFGCCTSVEDTTLINVYMQVSRMLVERNLWHCSAHIQDLLCQPCSPYAAHIYDAEGTGQSRPFPGLCEGHCRMLYRQCAEALYIFIAYINGPQELRRSLSSEDAFCQMVNLTDTDYCYPDLLTNPILTGNIQPSIVNSEGCLCLETFASDLRNPVFMRYPEDGSGRLFVGQQNGIVLIYYEDKTWLPEPFLNISSTVTVSRASWDERGMLGLAFHPQYRHNKRFFVYYYTDQGGPKIRISEFTVYPWNPDKADVQSERYLIEVDQPYINHNGGEMLFADDGYLYAFIGDGGGAGDTENYSQNMSVLLGKVIRIDVDTPVQPYAIPPDNPFLHIPEARPEIYAYGVRNIWRCGKDRGDPVTGYGKGRILCGDVGQSAYEELDFLKPGVNYGWRGYEGYECYDEEMCGNIGPVEPPIFAYPHSVGKSITGGHFYRGCEHPNLNGFYIYGDYFVGKLFRLRENSATGTWDNRQIDMCGPEYCKNGLHSDYAQWVLAFAEDRRGEVYLLNSASSSSAIPDANIFKLVDPRRRNNPLMCHERGRGSSIGRLQSDLPIVVENSTVKKPANPKQNPTQSPKQKSEDTSGCQNLSETVLTSVSFCITLVLLLGGY